MIKISMNPERIYVILLVLFSLMSPMLMATDQTIEERRDSLQEVTVVNQRIATISQSLATPVIAVFMRQMEAEQRMTYKDLSGMVPNLYIPDYGSRMTSSIYIRGLGARIDNPVLGLYVDGVGLGNKNSYDFDLFDIRSMHLYRGPQGTIFGRNTIGGVLSLETISPLTYQGTRASVGYGNYNSIDAKVSHYRLFDNIQCNNEQMIKNNDTNGILGMGVSAYYRHTDGYFINRYDNSPADISDEAGVRLRFDAEKTDCYKNSTFANYNLVKQGGFAYHLPDEEVNHNDPCTYLRHNFTLGSHYTSPVSDYILSGTTAYQYLQDEMQMDQDYLPLSYFTLTQAQKEHYVSQELTLKPKNPFMGTIRNKTDNNSFSWNWLTGIQLSYRHNKMYAPVHFMQTGIDSLIIKNANNGIHMAFPQADMLLQEDNFVIDSRFLVNAIDIAAYHTTYLTWKNWQLEAGIRMDFEYQSFNYLSDGMIHYRVTNTPITEYREIHSILNGATSLSYFEVLPKIALSYNAEGHWRAYVSVAEGYKAGGFNTQLFSDILQNRMMQDIMRDMGVSFSAGSEYAVSEVITYKPERCLNFEVGLSGNFTRDDINLNGELTMFESEVFNQQLTIFPIVGTGRLMTNAGHSRCMGAELTGNLKWKNLMIETSYGYTYAVFVNYDNGRVNFAKNHVPYAPEHTLSTGVTYRIPFKHEICRSLYINANTQAFGRIFWNEENTEIQPFYALLNANIGLQMKYVSLELWGKNLTQTQYDVFRFVSMGNTLLQSGKPITFGARIKFEM